MPNHSTLATIRNQWNEEKRAPLDDSDITELVTSFTDKQPMHGWTRTDDIRELWQNFKDGLKARFKQPILFKFETDGDCVGTLISGEEVGRVVLSRPNYLEFQQLFCELNINHLQLASIKTGDEVGGHGEGFKVAVNHLLNRGCTEITYEMRFRRWIFSLKRKYGDRLHNMCIDIQKTGNDIDYLKVRIHGHGIHKNFDKQMDIELMHDQVLKCVSSVKGSLYLTKNNNYNLFGMVYCKNLKVGIDVELSILELVADINTQLSRDRHHLPANLWDAIESIMSQQQPSNSELYEHLLSRLKVLPKMAPVRKSLKPLLKRYLARKEPRLLSETKIVFVEQDHKPQQELLQAMGYKSIVIPCLNDGIDMEEIRKTFIENAPVIADWTKVTRISEKVKLLEELIEAMRRILGYRSKLQVKELAEELTEYLPLIQRSTGNIIVSMNQFETEEPGPLATSVLMATIARYGLKTAQRNSLSQMLCKLVQDPKSFKGSNFSLPTPRLDDNTTSKTVPKPSSPNTGAREEVIDQTGDFEQPSTSNGTPAPNVRRSDMEIDPRIFNARPDSVDYSRPVLIRPDDHDHVADKRQCLFVGELRPYHFDPNIAIYVDDTDRARSLDHDAVSAFVRIIHDAAENMMSKIGERLGLNMSLLSFSLVVVDPHLLAFTDPSGHIFLNLVPLEGLEREEKRGALNMHLFHSILHEIAHRAHRNHDSHFADLLAKLVAKVLYHPI